MEDHYNNTRIKEVAKDTVQLLERIIEVGEAGPTDDRILRQGGEILHELRKIVRLETKLNPYQLGGKRLIYAMSAVTGRPSFEYKRDETENNDQLDRLKSNILAYLDRFLNDFARLVQYCPITLRDREHLKEVLRFIEASYLPFEVKMV